MIDPAGGEGGRQRGGGLVAMHEYPDGLRALHRAYPVLEGLHIPLTRQNLDADDEVAPSD